MRIHLYSVGWGEYNTLYHTYAKPSVMPSVERLKQQGHIVEFYHHDRACDLCENFILALQECIKADAYLFLLMPDTIYGAETLDNIAHYAQDTNAYVCVPHLRVCKEDWVCTPPVTNKELLDFVWRYPHFSTIHSNMNKIPNQGNVRLGLFPAGEYTIMHHYYPTIYFFKPCNEDVSFWQNRDPKAGWINYDTNFMNHAAGRNIRVIGSADFAIMAELEWKDSHHSVCTDQSKNLPKIVQGRHYAPLYFNTGYVMKKNIKDMGK